MGNSKSCGFGVVNNTNFNLTVCMSMGATHYFENDIAPGEVFYKWPGAVWYTMHVYPTEIGGRMTSGQITKEVGIATTIGITGGMLLAGGAVGITLVALSYSAAAAAAASAAAGEVAVDAAIGTSAGVTVGATGTISALEVLDKLKKNASLVLGDDTVDHISERTRTVFNDAIASGFDVITSDDIDLASKPLDLQVGNSSKVAQTTTTGAKFAPANSPYSALNNKEPENHVVEDIMERFTKLGWRVSKTATEAMLRQMSSKEVIMQLALNVIKDSKMSGQVKGCYGGGCGTWLEVSGLPYAEEKDHEIHLITRDMQFKLLSSFSEAKQAFLDQGYRFTAKSHERYYGKKDLNRLIE